MDILLYLLSAACNLLGLVGAVAPGLPGAPLNFLGMVLLHLTDAVDFSTRDFVIAGVVCIVVTVVDFIVPAMCTKKFGGSKYGVWGSIVGLFVGLFSPLPLGFIWGPFVGAVGGELLAGKQSNEALRSGVGSFVGFILSTGLKLAVGLAFCWVYISSVYDVAAAALEKL